ncbi:MAG: ATP-binding protein [Solirubrobacteraceae bacterium]
MAIATGFELVGREIELGRLLRFVGDLAASPSGVAIRGEAGIGKTVLWRGAVDAAEQAGVRVLLTRCVEAELPLALGGLGDLIDAALSEIAEDLPRPQREALAVAAGLEAAADERPDRLALPRAFTSYLGALARRTPVLVAVDDVQWLDVPSQRILAFAVRRLGDAPFGILVTQRGDGADPLDLVHALDERFEEIRVGPLSIGALHHLVRSRLGVRIVRPTLARVHEASGGNPMFALEFARAIAGRGGAAPGPLPVPSSLEDLVHTRIAAFPPRIRTLLAAAAAVERPTLPLLQAAIEGAGPLLDEASETGAVLFDEDGLVRFAHPLLASAAYAAVPPVRRRELHARLAAVSGDLGERARQLALASGAASRDVARSLDEAAASLSARGAPDAAAELARQAVRLTPTGDHADSEERSLAAAGYLVEAGRLADSVAVLDELLTTGISGPRRARALLLRCFTELDGERTMRLAEEALEHVGDDRALRVEVLLYLSHGAAERDVAAAEERARGALAAAEELNDPQLLSTTLNTVERHAAVQGRPEPALLDRATRLVEAHGAARWSSPGTGLAERRLWAGDLAGARALLEAELDALCSRGIYYGRKQLLRDLVDLEWRAGNWDRAERHLDDHRELTFDGGDRFHEAVALWQQGLLAASRGQVEAARQHALDAVDRGKNWRWPSLVTLGQWVLGFLALSLNEPTEASDALAGVPETLERLGIGEPGLWPILPDAIEAAVAVGRLDEAEATAATLEAQARALEHRWATPAARRCRGLLLLAQGDSAAALAAAEDAASGFEPAGFPLDRGRALLVAGEALRRLGERRRAAEKLETAKGVFSDLGAPLWLARVEKELRRASPRPRSDGELTSAERGVASLVAAGRTNREVSAQLFTTVGTVEVHLTRIYRKVGVRSRTELARLVADGTLDLEDA